MKSQSFMSSWAGRLMLAGMLLMPLATIVSLAQAVDQPVVRSVGCNPDSLSAALKANTVAPIADSEDESVPEEQQPALKGSIELKGVDEDDSKAIAAAIAAKGLTTISPTDATTAAKAALVDADQRSFKNPKLELENEQAVWAIETSRKGGVNPSLEVKVDAGNGNILSIECD
jgi:uncharacterized membrane protein YkoI